MSRINREDDLAQMMQRMDDRIRSLESFIRTSCFKTGDLRLSSTSAQLDGWVECDGRAVLRSEFPSLNKLLGDLGYPFGNGNGTTTFNIPDFRGRVPVGAGTGTGGGASGAAGTVPTGGTALTARAAGSWTGQETVAITAAQTGIRNHVHAGTTDNSGSLDHNHHMTSESGGGGTPALVSQSGKNQIRFSDNPVGGDGSPSMNGDGGFWGFIGVGGIVGGSIAHGHTFTSGNPNGGEQSGSAHTNVQPQLAVNFFIKT